MANKYKTYKYSGTYKCGHEAVIYKGGYTKEYANESAEKEFGGLCPDCAKVELDRKRAEESARAAEEAKEMGLPELVGSEKQIAWALTIREGFIKFGEEFAKRTVEDGIDACSRAAMEALVPDIENRAKAIDDAESDEERKRLIDAATVDFNRNVLAAVSNMLTTETSAKIYIEARDILKEKHLLLDHLIQYVPATEEEKMEQAAIEDIVKEHTAIPSEYNQSNVTVIITDDTVAVESEKDDTVIEALKELDFKWNRDVSKWVAKKSLASMDIRDRAAEAINKLMRLGCGVICMDKEALDKGVNGDYTPHNRRLIYVDKGVPGRFAITLPNGDDMYDRASRVRGARYERDYRIISVPATNYMEIRDFAELNGCYMAASAERLAQEEEERQRTRVEVANPPKIETAEDKLQEILESPSDVLDDLKEDA